jgi:serine O-acetyltransferase
MIQSKIDLQYYNSTDMAFYFQYSKRDRIIAKLTQDPVYLIVKYIRYLRKEEYFYNVRHDFLGKFLHLFYFRKKNILGNKLGFKIPKNCFGPGLTIYHHGCIIINENARIGSNCCLHGNNCIGNDGKTDIAPQVGNHLDLGFGASIIGNVSLCNNIRVGANAVVVHSHPKNNITLVGIPAVDI